MLEHAITLFNNTAIRWENSFDSAMIIAMDLLYSDKVDGFFACFQWFWFYTLAIRLRESGMKVIGIVNKNTKLFIVACDRLFISKFRWRHKEKSKKATRLKNRWNYETLEKNHFKKIDSDTIELIETIEGWWRWWLGIFGDVEIWLLRETRIRSRNYGFSKLTLCSNHWLTY
jgi:hypothetical protein